jgi:glycosyltransferase involved in cell wall biosynthesis
MKKKKIWFINQAAGSPYHGMVFRTYYLAQEMVKLGHEVTIFSGSFSHNYFKLPETSGLFTEQKIDGIKYVWVKLLPYPQSKSAGRVLAMFSFPFKLLFYRTDECPDAIIVSSPPPIPVLVGWLWAKLKRAKLIFEVRDIWPLSIEMLGGYGPKNPFIAFLRFVESFAYRQSDRVSSVLPKAFLHFESKGMVKDKFLYVPNGVIEDDHVPGYSPTFQSLVDLKKSGSFIIGYAGTVGFANNLDVFLKAAVLLQEHQNIKFVILGEGSHKKGLIKDVEKLGLANMVFLPAVAKKEIPSILEKFDLGYIGLMKEDLFKFGISPNKIFDYMFARLPIVMAIDSGNDIVQDANCGRSVPSCHPEDIASAIKELHDLRPEERLQLGDNGFQFVNSYHRYDKVVEAYLESF